MPLLIDVGLEESDYENEELTNENAEVYAEDEMNGDIAQNGTGYEHDELEEETEEEDEEADDASNLK